MKKLIYLILSLTFSGAITKAQIPNGDFETWTSMGSYNNPNSWDCFNNMTTSMNTYTCVKGTPGAVGTAYLKLTSKSVTGMGVMPGVAVCGTIDMSTLMPSGGFAYTDRPQSMTGKWQYMASGSDQGFISAFFTKWNSGTMMHDTVAYAMHALSGMAMSWANFTIPISYVNGDSPDSAIIILSASGSSPVANSYLYVDNLAFAGTVLGISNSNIETKISIFPNPASDKVILDLSSLKAGKVSVAIFDVAGRQLKTIDNLDVSSNSPIDISFLPKGNFMLKISNGSEIITKNFIKE